MPTYSYYCSTCEIKIDSQRSITEPEPTITCQTCEGELHRLFFSVPAIFKAGGFYSTDNKK